MANHARICIFLAVPASISRGWRGPERCRSGVKNRTANRSGCGLTSWTAWKSSAGNPSMKNSWSPSVTIFALASRLTRSLIAQCSSRKLPATRCSTMAITASWRRIASIWKTTPGGGLNRRLAGRRIRSSRSGALKLRGSSAIVLGQK